MLAQRSIWGLLLCALGGMSLFAAQPGGEPTAGDEAARQEILRSPDWKEAVDGFRQWLSVQIVYPPSQVPQLMAEFQARVDKMSAAELRSYLADLQRKLAILKGPDAVEVRAWAQQRLNVYTDARGAEFRKSMPDVARMTALQVEQSLADLQRQRATHAANRQRFDQFRQREVAAARSKLQSQAAAASRSRSSARISGGSYAPRASTPRTIQRYPGPFLGWGVGGWRW